MTPMDPERAFKVWSSKPENEGKTRDFFERDYMYNPEYGTAADPAKMVTIKNVRITFPGLRTPVTVEPFEAEDNYDPDPVSVIVPVKYPDMSGRIKETTPEPVESWARRAFFATSHKDAVPLDIESRRFMVIEHEAQLNPQIATYQRGYADQITRDAQAILKFSMGETYGRFGGKSRVVEEIYREMKAARDRADMTTYRRLHGTINSVYGKYTTEFPITHTPERVAWLRSVFPDYKPPYMGPVITDLWTSAAYPLGVPERRWNYYEEVPPTITPDVFERYCLRDLEISRHHFEAAQLSKPTRHPRGKY